MTQRREKRVPPRMPVTSGDPAAFASSLARSHSARHAANAVVTSAVPASSNAGSGSSCGPVAPQAGHLLAGQQRTEPVVLHFRHVPDQAQQRQPRRRDRLVAQLRIGQAVTLHGELARCRSSQAASICRSPASGGEMTRSTLTPRRYARHTGAYRDLPRSAARRHDAPQAPRCQPVGVTEADHEHTPAR